MHIAPANRKILASLSALAALSIGFQTAQAQFAAPTCVPPNCSPAVIQNISVTTGAPQSASINVTGDAKLGATFQAGANAPVLSAAGSNLIYGNVDAASSAGSLLLLQNGAVDRLRMTLAGQMQVPDGSSAAPSYSFGGDSAMGMYRVGTALSLRGNGSITLGGGAATIETITTTGVGIGTTAPSTLLYLAGNTPIISLQGLGSGGATQGIQFKYGSATAYAGYIGSITQAGGGGSLVFAPASTGAVQTEAMRIAPSGNVGIGTAAPGTLNGVTFPSVGLHVKGAGVSRYIAVDDSNAVGVLLNDSSQPINSRMWGFLNQATRFSISPFSDAGSPTERVSVLRNGNVGIGTTSPAYKLDVNGNSNITGDLTVSGTITGSGLATAAGASNYVAKFTATSALGNSQIFDNGTSVGIGTALPNGKLDVVSAAGEAGGVFRNAGVGDTWLPYIDGKNYIRGTTIMADVGGSVGIGTNPATKLHVYDGNNMGLGNLLVESTGGDGVIRIMGGSTNQGFIRYNDAGQYLSLSNATPYNDQLVVSNGGKVGIGTAAPRASLDVQGSGLIALGGGFYANSNLSVANSYQRYSMGYGIYWDVANSNYTVTDTLYNRGTFSDENGVFTWASVGGALTSPQTYAQWHAYDRMKLDTGGNLTLTTGGLTVSGNITSGGQNVCRQNGVNCPASVTGSGTLNYIPKFTAASVLGDSQIFDNGAGVGVGTAAPGAKLDVNGSFRVAGTAVFDGNVQLTQVGDTYVYDVLAVSTGSQGLNIDSAGAGPIRLNSNTGGIANAGTGGVQIYGGNNSAVQQIQLGGAGNSWFNSGNLGIGTNSPAYRLDVNGNGNIVGNLSVSGSIFGDGGFVRGSNSVDDADSALYLQYYNPLNGVIIGNGVTDSALSVYGAGAFTGNLTVAGQSVCRQNGVNCPATVTGSGTANYVAKFTGTGATVGNSQIFDDGTNVGIGTAAPARKLDVYESGAFSGIARIGNGSGYGELIGDGNGLAISSPSWALNLQTSSTSRLYIANGGNVGVGTTGPITKLHVQNGSSGIIFSPNARTAAVIEGSSSFGTVLSIIGPDTGNANGIFIGSPSNEAKGQLALNNVDGSMYFCNGGCGTASTLFISGAGNFGIGTTAPGEKLDIAGSARISQGNYLRFPHASESDTNDGKIGVGLFEPGLNFVGSKTDATYRKIALWGEITQLVNSGTNTWAGTNYFSGNMIGMNTAPVSNQTLSVYASGGSGKGIYSNSAGITGIGVYGIANASGGTGVQGDGSTYGVKGYSSANLGVYGQSVTGYGGYFTSSYIGAYATGSTYAFYGSGSTYTSASAFVGSDLNVPNNTWGAANGWYGCGNGGYCVCADGSFVGQIYRDPADNWWGALQIYCYKP